MKTARIEILNASESRIKSKKLVHEVWELLAYEVESRTFQNTRTHYKSFIHRGSGKFATGLIPIIKSKLEKNGYNLRISEPERTILEPDADVPSTFAELDEYQSRAINKVNGHPRGLFISGTGSGKTHMELQAIFSSSMRFL